MSAQRAVYEAVSEAIRQGWTVRKFIEECREAWIETLRIASERAEAHFNAALEKGGGDG